MFHDCLKLYKFGIHHWKMIWLAAACMAMYTSFTGIQLALVKPVIDNLTRSEGSPAVKNIEQIELHPPGMSPEQINAYEMWQGKAKALIIESSPVKKIKSFSDKITSSFTNIGLTAISLAPFIFLSFYGQRYFANYVIWAITRDIRDSVCEHLLPQSLTFFDNKKSGELISRITNDITTTQGAVNILFSHVLLQPMKLLFGLALGLYFDWKLTLISFVALPLIVVSVVVFGKKVKEHGKSSLKSLADLTDTLREMFSGIRIVKAYSMEDEEAAEINTINQKFFKKKMKASVARATSNGVTEFIYSLGLGAIVIIGGIMVTSGRISPGELGGFITAIGFMVFKSIKQLAKSYNTLQDSLAGANRVFEILDDVKSNKEMDGEDELTCLRDNITFNNVSFSYDSRPVMNGINFTIKNGDTVGLVGQSGAGKSTIINLILRFYHPTAGNIEIDGKDIRLFTHRTLLDQIALVTQQTFLFNRSIGDNIRYGNRKSTDSQLESAARAADIHDFIVGLPRGYDTITGEMGVKLSGGQRQRIAIARAFLKDAPILILDEATSSLDSRSEQSVQETLSRLMKGKTTIIVAHKLSTIRDCSKILVVKKGEIVETGTHEELANANGEYDLLYKMQKEW